MKKKLIRSVTSDSLRPHRLLPTRLLRPWDFPGKNTGVGCHFLLQGIFPTQGLNPGLPHCRQMLYPLSHQGSPYPTAYVMPFIFTHTLKHSVLQFNSHTHQATCLTAAEDHWYPLTNFESSYLDGNSVQLSCSVVSSFLQPHELKHARPPCPSPTPRVHPNPCPSSRWYHPTISSSVVPFSSCPQSFPASGSFQMSQLFAWGGQSTGVSASTSVLPMNTQDWSPLGWTGWISLQSKGLSRVFSNTN